MKPTLVKRPLYWSLSIALLVVMGCEKKNPDPCNRLFACEFSFVGAEMKQETAKVVKEDYFGYVVFNYASDLDNYGKYPPNYTPGRVQTSEDRSVLWDYADQIGSKTFAICKSEFKEPLKLGDVVNISFAKSSCDQKKVAMSLQFISNIETYAFRAKLISFTKIKINS